MEPYCAMLDYRIFISPAYLELSMDAQCRFAQLVGTSDRMGVANLYYIWNDGHIKADLMHSLYKSGLVWEVDPYYCFIPSVYNANNRMRSGKYKLSFDVKGFQACVDKYPILYQSMTENKRQFIRDKGIILPIDEKETPTVNTAASAPLLEYAKADDPVTGTIDASNYITFQGVMMDRRDYNKYLILKMTYRDFEEKNNVSILSEQDIADWFMRLYRDGFRYKGTPISDLPSLFMSYCSKVLTNKRIQGAVVVRGAYV